jgi:hypothetical protein
MSAFVLAHIDADTPPCHDMNKLNVFPWDYAIPKFVFRQALSLVKNATGNSIILPVVHAFQDPVHFHLRRSMDATCKAQSGTHRSCSCRNAWWLWLR